jgi:hypothetical protein
VLFGTKGLSDGMFWQFEPFVQFHCAPQKIKPVYEKEGLSPLFHWFTLNYGFTYFFAFSMASSSVAAVTYRPLIKMKANREQGPQ